MDLPVIWFAILAILWTGFFVLEGFDFGVGILHWFVGRNDTERRVAINSIGPFWDANEVWLVVAAAGTFAAFPGWYATMFSSLYLALVVILVALIFRGLAFEYRGKSENPRWRKVWSLGLVVSSVVIPLFLGIGLGDLLAGLPIGADQEYAGTFWNLFTPYGLLTGATFLSLCLLHGATFLGLKTTDLIRQRSHRLARIFGGTSLVLGLTWVISTYLIADGVSAIAIGFLTLLVLGVAAAATMTARERDGWAFAASAVAIGSVTGSLFASLYPNVMISSTDASNTLTIANTASGNYALTVMTIVAVIMFPLVLLYQGWNYYVFRQRVTTPPTEPSQTHARGSRPEDEASALDPGSG